MKKKDSPINKILDAVKEVLKKENKIKKQRITCKKCGKTRDYLLRKKPNYCTWCGHKFTFLEKLTFRS